jgi:biopolymer transport protein ExbB
MEMFDKIGQAFQHGGFWMYPILILQVVTLSIIVERAYALFVKRKTNQHNFIAGLEDNIRRGELDQVIKKANAAKNEYAIAGAVVAGAEAALAYGGKEEIQGKMDEVLLHENSMLDRRISFLSMLGNVSTLLGLLGTITGMIKSFASVAYANPAEKAALLAAGISEAMNATAYGLIVAIPALLAYAVYQNRANHLAEDINQSGLKVFNWLSYAFDPASLRANKVVGGKKSTSEEREMNA